MLECNVKHENGKLEISSSSLEDQYNEEMIREMHESGLTIDEISEMTGWSWSSEEICELLGIDDEDYDSEDD